MFVANSVNMKTYPFASELEITIMFFIIITSHFFLTQSLKYALDIRVDSNFVIYLGLILLFMIFSNIFRMITINGFQFSLLKINIYCSIGYTIVLMILFFGFRDFLYFNFENDFQKLNMHLTSILADICDDHVFQLSFELFLFFSILFSGLFIFILMPSITRFAENYVKTIGKFYSYLEKEKKVSPENKKTEEENTENSNVSTVSNEEERKNSWTLKIFNLRLIFNLLILFFWVKPMMSPWVSFIGSEEMIKLLRTLFCLTYCLILVYGYKYEIEIHFKKIYEALKTLFVDPGNSNFINVRFRITNLLQTSLMITYIVITKFIIPLVLLYMLTYKSNFGGVAQPNFTNFKKFQQINRLNLTMSQKNDIILYASDWKCLITRSFKDIISQVIKNPIGQNLIIHSVGLNYGFYGPQKEKMTENYMKVLKNVLRKINIYGFIPDEFYQNVLSFWLFSYFFGNYFLGVFYIIFLRKSNNL